MPALDQKTPFDPSKVPPMPEILRVPTYDLHQLGLPINSFIAELGKATQRPAEQLFIDSFKQVSAAPEEAAAGLPDYQCTNPGTAEFVPWTQNVPNMTLRAIFAQFRRAFRSPTESLDFNRLWKNHGLDKVIILAEIDGDLVAEYEVLDDFQAALESALGNAPANDPAVLGIQSKCQAGFLTPTRTACSLVCKRNQ